MSWLAVGLGQQATAEAADIVDLKQELAGELMLHSDVDQDRVRDLQVGIDHFVEDPALSDRRVYQCRRHRA